MRTFIVYFYDAKGDSRLVEVQAESHAEARFKVLADYPGASITHIDRDGKPGA